MELPSKQLELKLFKNGYKAVFGVDEVGMGCLAGPVVACAVLLDKKFFQKSHRELAGVRDSKLLSAKQREALAELLLREPHLKYRLAFCYPKTIDRINIYRAARRAMKRATSMVILRVHSQDDHASSVVLVDGPRKIDGLKFDQIPIIKGDRKVFTIACASIIAKVARDKMMARYAKKYPNYGFEKHKGYGTKYHVAQLTAHGPSKIHRSSFAPVAKLM